MNRNKQSGFITLIIFAVMAAFAAGGVVVKSIYDRDEGKAQKTEQVQTAPNADASTDK